MLRSLTKPFSNHHSHGFTIVEILIVVTVSVILAGVLWGPLDDLYYDNARGVKSIIQTSDTHGALHFIKQNITISNSFLSANQVADPSGATWNYAGSAANKRTLITQNYATSKNEGDGTSADRSLVYSNSNCSTPVFNNFVYFVNGSTLYRRTLKNTTSPVYAWSSGVCTVSTVGQKQTCASGCANRDAVILTGVTDFVIHYYPNSASSSYPTDEYTNFPSGAKTITVTAKTRSGLSGIDTGSESTIRITQANGL